jgi:hypothetical protein
MNRRRILNGGRTGGLIGIRMMYVGLNVGVQMRILYLNVQMMNVIPIGQDMVIQPILHLTFVV